MPLTKGSAIGGRYTLRRPLGEGGVGVVWEADSALFGPVAVKLLRSELARDPDAVERFAAEARSAAAISHPHVIAIYDIGATIDEVPFFVMELCDGETLESVVASRGAVGFEYACELSCQVLGALAAAHDHGIVHRDLKPGNIMVVHPEPDKHEVKVLDFGIACRVSSEPATPAGKVYGTPSYMAPEQILGRAVDQRVDLYAVGAILYELLTGRRPFQGRNDAEIMTHVLQRPPMPLRAYDRTLPAALEELIRRCLSKDPARRPASAKELLGELVKFLPPQARGALLSTPKRERRKSLPLPLVKRTSDPVEDVHSEPALPLVKRGSATGPGSKRRAVLELVGDATNPGDDE
ncbi:MAG: serine/threonine protein kinase [Myxococcales bacterium]|nr:serine/threonine protein kinase [Myxococcales bacterium]